MILSEYLAQRRRQIEELIAAETLAGNDFKRDCEKAALAELDGIELNVRDEQFYKMSTDGKTHTFEAHGINAPQALTAIIQHIVIETIKAHTEVSDGH